VIAGIKVDELLSPGYRIESFEHPLLDILKLALMLIQLAA